MESNYEGYNYAVKYIMRSGLPGIEGVVAELMQVPAGYEIAIETALGAQMQNIICSTDQDAKSAVNKLKENRSQRTAPERKILQRQGFSLFFVHASRLCSGPKNEILLQGEFFHN